MFILNKIILLSFFVLISMGIKAQKYKSDIIYDAYINKKIDVWKKVCDEMEQSENSSNEFLLSLINIEYGYIAHCISISDNKEAIKYLTLAEINLQKIEIKKYMPSLVMSYKSAFYSFWAALDSKIALKSAMNSLTLAEKSIKEDSLNYFGFLQRGNIYRHSPAVFNGSKHKALTYYLKAESLLLKQIITKKNWNYMQLLVTITETYIEIKDLKNAEKYYDKILKLEPNFYKTKDVLAKKIKDSKQVKKTIAN